VKTSDAGIYALALHEGIVPAPYKDSVGVWTFGIGHTAGAGDPDPATMPKGMPADLDRALVRVFDVFRHDLPKYEAGVNRALKVPVTQAQFDALVSFHYNTGAIGRATLVKKLNAGDVAGAAAGFMSWVKPPEITERRKAEQALFATGTYPGGQVTVWGATSAGKVVWKPVKRLNMPQVLALLRGDAAKPGPAPVAPPPAPEAPAHTPVSAPPAAYVAAVMATAYAVWEWGAAAWDAITFWN
jgi:lysozyme